MMRRVGPFKHTRAFTLLEMVVVLAIVVTTTAFTWPALRKSLARGQLLDSAKLVRTVLARARLEAIESGRPRMFRYELEGRRFEVLPVTGSPATTADEFGTIGSSATESEAVATYSADLPVGMRFVSRAWGRSVDFDRADPTRLPAGDSSSAASAGIDWAEPIVFYPHGGAQDAELRLVGEGGIGTILWLRGLTGTAIIDEPRREETSP